MAFTNIPFRVLRYSMKCNYCFIKPVKNRQIVSNKWFSVHYLSISTVSKQQSVINVTEQDVKTDNLNFDEHVDIFKKKSFTELLRSYLIFGLCSSDLLVSKSGWLLRTGERILGERLMSVILKSTLYGQFVAGETRPEIEKTIKALKAAGIGSLLGMPMEQDADDNAGERHNWFEKNFKIMMDAIDLVYELDKEFPMTHAKMTALMPTDILLKIDGLNTAQLEELQEALYKLRRIGEYAVEKDVIFMFDAEHTYVNPGLNILTLAMMLNYNHSKPLIFYTYQSYLKGSTDNLEQDLNFVQKHGVKLGAKVVRGAYMDLERARALKQGYADPVNDTYKETCWRYETNVEKMLKKIAKYPQHYRMMIATHNEESIKKLYKKIEEHGVDRRNGTVFFAQTFGMSDHISFTLGDSDVLIYKALPYGPVNETLAYLARRLQENKSVLKGARREQKLLLHTGERILGERLMSVILKPTLYGQFVAGETRPEIEKTTTSLKAAGIGSLLGMPMEQDADDNAGERHNWYEKNFKIMMDAIDLVYELDKEFPMTHAKVTALMPTDILLKIDGLNTAQLEELQEALYKLRRIGEYAVEKDVIFMFDAEHTYVNPGLNILTLAMMLNYNHSKPLIFFTYQSYLKGSTDNLEQDLNFVLKHGVKLGAKVVRGAYMDLERARALKQGYADPVNNTYKETCWRYETNVEKMLKKIAKYPQHYRMMIATHNEESIKKLYKKVEEHGVDRRNGTVFFAQIFGMGDHISFTLGDSDVLIYKALPYGPVNETLAYLVRRLQENKAILKGARREQKLVEQSLKGRLTFWKN
ncbi:Hypothetical predicted protein [Octopus vulgaris]|uniref:Hydroxyproline dehydrogenase n=1 Tax=Octopus vulgaris TaxID=6645 RepID=A0AA36BQQ3_OCTVU|nr:Hypothetical predicted protein [Octopus vulgaris]